MKIKISQRGRIPECELFINVMQQGTTDLAVLGKDRPVMFLLPGGPGGNHTVYDGIKDNLLEFADLVLIDPRGCGLSSPSEVEFCTMENSAEDIESLRVALGIEKFVLFGGSYGAMVSLTYAINYSDILSSLILVAGAPSGDCYDTALKKLKKVGTPEQIALTEKLFLGEIKTREEHEKYYSIMRNIYLGKFGSDYVDLSKELPTVEKKIPYFLQLNNFGHTNILPNYDIVDSLHRISAPTLLLAGEKDWINDISYAYQMKGLIPDSELVIFPESGHFVWKGVESHFFSVIRTFFQEKILSDRTTYRLIP